MPRKNLTLRLKAYILIDDSIADSIPSGIRKYLKYHDNISLSDSDIDSMAEMIHRYIMADLCEVVDFDKSG